MVEWDKEQSQTKRVYRTKITRPYLYYKEGLVYTTKGCTERSGMLVWDPAPSVKSGFKHYLAL